MFKNPDEMLKYIRDEKVEFVDLKVIDLPGRWRHMTFLAEHLDEKIFTQGYGLSLSPYPGYRVINNSDMTARPDPSTAFLDPFKEHKTLAVISDMFYTDGAPYERNPRDIVRRAEARIKKVIGVDARSQWLPEMEFYLLRAARYGSAVNKGYFEIFSDTGSWGDLDQDFPEHQSKMPDTGVGQIDSPRDIHANVRALMVRRIADAGYKVKYHHHELGGAGQCEIEPYFDTILRAADSVMVMKYMIHNTAREQGLCATFLPKPMNGAPGNGMHFHQYFEKDGKSLFYGGPDQYACLNDMARQYLGGLLKHTPALMAFCCPTMNSYRRFGVGLAAPMNLFFGDSNRSSALRIPGYSKNEIEHRVEYRLPDGLCNPYIAVAAQLMAGLDGIATKIDPTAEGFGPFDFNNYTLSDTERAKIKSGPTSLRSALQGLDEDHDFLTAGSVFPEEIVPTWINLKLLEMDEQSRRPHPYDFELYFDF